MTNKLIKKNQRVHRVNIGIITTLGVIAIELKTTVLCLFVVVCCCVGSEAGPKIGREKVFGSIFHMDPFFARVDCCLLNIMVQMCDTLFKKCHVL